MAEKMSIYAGEPLAGVLVGFEDNRSARINAVADAYRIFVADNTPAFIAGEWLALADVTNGAWIDMPGLRLTWASMSDAAADGIGQKWGIDPEAFAQRLRKLRDSEMLAIREVIARWWNAKDTSDGSTADAELLRQCGARLSDSAPPHGASAALLSSLRGLGVTEAEAAAMQQAVEELRGK